MIAAAARQLVPPSSVCPHQPQHVGSSTKTLLASSEAHEPQRNCLRRPGDPNSVGTGTATGSAALAMKDGGPKQRAAGGTNQKRTEKNVVAVVLMRMKPLCKNNVIICCC